MANKKSHYIYILKLIPRLMIESNWSKEDEEIVDRHFKALQELLKEGRLIWAGKTSGLDERTFGIVMVEADSEEKAREIMEADPSVKEGIMNAELFPFDLALLKKN